MFSYLDMQVSLNSTSHSHPPLKDIPYRHHPYKDPYLAIDIREAGTNPWIRIHKSQGLMQCELRTGVLTNIHMCHRGSKMLQHRSLPRHSHCYRCASTVHTWMWRHCRSPSVARRCDRGRGLHCSVGKGALRQMSTPPGSVVESIRCNVNHFGKLLFSKHLPCSSSN